MEGAKYLQNDDVNCTWLGCSIGQASLAINQYILGDYNRTRPRQHDRDVFDVTKV
ncbi:MAG: hypothetical protein ACJAX5_003448, partial [Patiriisocius sp.]